MIGSIIVEKLYIKKKIAMNNVSIIIIFKLPLFSNLSKNVWTMPDKNLNSKFLCILHVNEFSDIFHKNNLFPEVLIELG